MILRKQRPEKQGLYDPEMEHDACGVGFVVDIKGRKSHEIVQQSLELLINLLHRGACGCDPETGDGAGILLQIPHEFYKKACSKLGFELPDPGQYGVGMIFQSTVKAERELCEKAMEESIAAHGLDLLGWRDVPVVPSAVGKVAREAMPTFRQVFVKHRGDLTDQDAFERRIYLVRKAVHQLISEERVPNQLSYYVASFSSRTVIYKGMLIADQIAPFYPDLKDPDVKSAIGLVHSRFSTNTFPSWELAHPYRMIAHNGEINTLRGNRNWMRAREATLQSPLFGDDIKKLFPLVTETGSDTATFDNALEVLVMGGRSLPHAVMMMVPEAYTKDPTMTEEKRAFYEYHACLMEPWDGPAAISFTDGVQVGCILDRNGLRPGRYWVTNDDRMIFASETGVLDIPVENIRYKGKMKPGRMLLVDTAEQRIIDDEEIKHRVASHKPYGEWVDKYIIDLDKLPEPPEGSVKQPDHDTLLRRQQAFGYTL
ncbi:MAG: glutamate synthase subunit alpha, partial [Candidatus Sumerlaeaceae bacterium]|nr:glutamate synthase subunit alpha [Candidatus Sumerlaeaceae bacterium]